MTPQQFINQVRELIARNELDAALRQLRELFDQSPQLDEVNLQSSRYHDIKKLIRLGLVSHQEATLTQQQIKAGLLELIREIEASALPSDEPAPSTDLPAEIQRAISIVGSKNLVIDSHLTAGGNIQIGDSLTVNNQDAEIKTQFNGGTFNNPTFH